MIWISCEGENPADIENLGPIQYIPQRGFPGYYYPFSNQKGYLAPVMAIKFERPKSESQLQRIEMCNLYKLTNHVNFQLVC